MNIIAVDRDNIDKEHICCAISDKKEGSCAADKKAWCPIEAADYMHIDCFWVSGKFKGQGYGAALLAECIEDAKQKGKVGVTALSSEKKMPFLSDGAYLKHKDFQVADKVPPYYELMYLPSFEGSGVPKFMDCVRRGTTDEQGMVLYYTNQCPHTEKYAPMLKEIAARRGREVKLFKIETAEEARSAPSPFTTYSFFYNGEFITNETMSEKKFCTFMDDRGL